MKKSNAFLPKRKQEDLYFLVSEILKDLPETEMIILYGSYARNEYVEFDERVEFGIATTFMSDYDILVVTSGIDDEKVIKKLDELDGRFMTDKDAETQTPVQFINEDIHIFNQQLEEGKYFYSQIKEDGVILYDSEKFKLGKRKKLDSDEKQKQAQAYYDEKFGKANDKFTMAEYALMKGLYNESIFNLHQVFENCYYAIRLTFTLRSNKQHNLLKLHSSVRRYSPELAVIFSFNNAEEKRLFYLVKGAYVEARYNPQFLVTKDDIDALIPKVILLIDITRRICEARIKEYGDMIYIHAC